MSTDASSLPNDVALCHEIIAQQQETLAQLARQNQQLEHRLDQLLRRLYGPRAERVDPSQMSLFDLGPEEPAVVPGPVEQEPDATSKTKKQPKGHGRRAFPKEIERREILLDIPDTEKTCPCCGQKRREIGRVVTERLGFDPARFYVNRYVQLKYARPCEQSGVVTAEKPISPIERGNAEPDLLAFTAVERMLRIVALGRKNWLFAGSERGGRTAAILFTILASAKRHGLCTWSYLRDVLIRLADLKPGELELLLPDRWHEPQPAAA